MNYYELATARKSTRIFKDKPIPQDLLSEISAYFNSCKKLISTIDVELEILNSATLFEGHVGYKDYLIESPHYLVILSDSHQYDLENVGYIGEDMLLKLTQMGISSCWLTINNQEKLKTKLALDTKKDPLAVIAIGYEKPVPDIKRLDILNNSKVTLKQRSGYEAPKLFVNDAIYYDTMGIKGDNSILEHNSSLNNALIAACCSPSFLNRQPYRFITDNGTLSLVMLEDDETQPLDARLNLGIVMLNLYATLSQSSAIYCGWNLGATKKEYDLPEKAKIVAHINI